MDLFISLRLLRLLRHIDLRRLLHLASWAEKEAKAEAERRTQRADSEARRAAARAQTEGGRESRRAVANRALRSPVQRLRRRLASFLLSTTAYTRRRLQVAQYRFTYNVLSGFLLAREDAVDLLSALMAEEEEMQTRALFGAAIHRVNEDIETVRRSSGGLSRSTRSLSPRPSALSPSLF